MFGRIRTARRNQGPGNPVRVADKVIEHAAREHKDLRTVLRRNEELNGRGIGLHQQGYPMGYLRENPALILLVSASLAYGGDDGNR